MPRQDKRYDGGGVMCGNPFNHCTARGFMRPPLLPFLGAKGFEC